MGKGDKKTKKGKIFKASFGNSRKKKLIKAKLKRTASKKGLVTATADAGSKPKRTVSKKKEA